MSENLNTTVAAVKPSATAVYALGRDAAESARLQRQSDELRPDSIALLDRVGIGPGRSAIDLGCGPRASSNCWPSGCHRAAASWARTLTRPTSLWPGSSPVSAG